MTNSNLAPEVLTRWRNHEFYTEALVLAVDIGSKYIGLHLRLGPEVLAGETVVFEPRKSLETRRQKRHFRRNRRGRKQRIFQLRKWCERFGLPWLPIADWPKAMEPAFKLRLQGEQQPGSLTPEELVVCLRHILLRRGYDWHRFHDAEGRYPWGDASPLAARGEELSADCRKWLEGHHITQEIADQIIKSLPEENEDTRLDEHRSLVIEQLNRAAERSNREGLIPHLEAHCAARYEIRGRNKNYPREVLEEHAQRLIKGHATHLKNGTLEEAIGAYDEILIYHRKDETAQKEHWESKAGHCIFTGEKRAKADDEDVRRFRLLEFLCTRRYVVQLPKNRSERSTLRGQDIRRSSSEVIAWLLKHPAGQAEALPEKGELRDEFERRVCGEGEKLAPDPKSLNGDFFSQLRDLLYPRPSSAAQRAALSAKAAKDWFNIATKNSQSFEPSEVLTELKADRDGSPNSSFYDKRRQAALAEWFHPHTEFLIGPRAYLLGKKAPPAGQCHGWINQMLSRPKIAERLRAANHSGKPDYVMIEVAGDIARTEEGRKKIEDDQAKRRDKRDKFIEHYKLRGADENSLLRAELWDQQGGTHDNGSTARCPLTGTELTGGPMSANLEIAHIYPRAWGGPFQRDNLFLTTRDINRAMGDNPPALCSGYRRQNSQAMRWGSRKRELFTTEWQHGGRMPDWGFDTRVAQLARQLRDAMKTWLGISDENEFQRRVGTVSGYFTAQCRKAWLRDYRKDRADLRNHLYDAMVLAHIPPGAGLNSAACGGIFCTNAAQQPDGTFRYTYQPPQELGPDWQAFDRAHEHDCLVLRPRPSHPKNSRFDDSIYGVEKRVRDGEESKRLRIRERIDDPKVKVEDLKKWFREQSARSQAFAALFPESLWQNWIDENVRRKAAGEPFQRLQLPGFAPVRAISVDGTKTAFFDPRTLAPHNDSMGAKIPDERNIAIELYEVPPRRPGGKPKIVSRVVLHPRFRAMQKKWRELGIEFPTEKPLPENARRVARITKHDKLCLPLTREGEIADSWENAYRRVWFVPSALQSDGRAELKPAEFQEGELSTDETGAVNREGSRLFGLRLRLKSKYAPVNQGLLNLLRLNGLVLPA